MKKEQQNKTPTYVKVIAGILAGLMVFSAVAVALTVLFAN